MLGCLLEIAETLALTLIIFFVIQTFVAQPYKVQQRSMEHTLEPEQYVLVDKLTPRFDTYKRGDIVVFTPPEDWVQDDNTPFIKRVIGLGGDTVDIRDGNVYINDIQIDEADTCTPTRESAPPQPTTVQGDQDSWVDRRRRRVPDGRPPRQLGGLADVRARGGVAGHRPRLAALLAARHLRDPPDADLPGAGSRLSMSRLP